jgi:hypothetical protein
MREKSQGLQRPCSVDDFCDHYAKRGCHLEVRDGKGICAFYDHEIIDTWSHTEGLTVGLRKLGEMASVVIQPALDWFASLPAPARTSLTRSGINELPRGKRHRPSRHRV